MSNFGETLFGGSAFVRWTLSPFILIFALVIPFLIPEWTSAGVAIMVGIEIACLALLAGFWLPTKVANRAFRVLAGLVFVFYAGYLAQQFLFTDVAARIFERRGATPRNALIGFIVIGLPCLTFAIRGRFDPSSEESSDQPDKERPLLQSDASDVGRSTDAP